MDNFFLAVEDSAPNSNFSILLELSETSRSAEETVYISEADGARKVKSNAQSLRLHG